MAVRPLVFDESDEDRPPNRVVGLKGDVRDGTTPLPRVLPVVMLVFMPRMGDELPSARQGEGKQGRQGNSSFHEIGMAR